MDGKSDKICRAVIERMDGGYVFNFSYGRRGGKMTTGTKTNSPVPSEEAKVIFDKLIKGKRSKGYSERMRRWNKIMVENRPVRFQLLRARDFAEIVVELRDRMARASGYQWVTAPACNGGFLTSGHCPRPPIASRSIQSCVPNQSRWSSRNFSRYTELGLCWHRYVITE